VNLQARPFAQAKKIMKRINNLYSKIISMENLAEAEQKARRGKSHQYGVQAFGKAPEKNLAEFQ
jgi:hypothetical protein